MSGWLDYYSRHFDTVEINNTFYRLPEAATFAAWARRAPAGFVYSVKASRFLTHMKKLKDPKEPLRRFFTRASRLEHAFGPVLYQLPPHWPVNVERLHSFLDSLPPSRRHAIEFREPSWYADPVLALLERYGVALCLHDMQGSASGRLSIGPFVYLRFHGAQKYAGRYDDATLEQWAAWLADRAREGRPIYAYFNNDVGGHAPRDAVRLRRLLGQVGLVGDVRQVEDARQGRQVRHGGQVGQVEHGGQVEQVGQDGQVEQVKRVQQVSRRGRGAKVRNVRR